MKVPILDPQKQNFPIKSELEQVVLKVLNSGQYILGQEVKDFEKKIADYLEVEEAIGVSSGTDALILSLMTLGIGPGDEVICPSFTFFATAGAIARVGARPVFVDIYRDCFTIDVSSIMRAITKKTKAIIPVHLFGQSADMTSILNLAKRFGLIIIEDAAQAIGSKCLGSYIGSFGATGCFSFFPSKNLGGFGDAGLITTQDKDLAKELRIMRVHGGREQYIHQQVGGNFRIDALQAALLSVKLDSLDEMGQLRFEHAVQYNYALSSCSLYELPYMRRGLHVYNQFTIRVLYGQRDKLREFLSKKGIGTGIYYPIPLHRQECFKDIVPYDLFLTETDLASQECLSLPISSELTKAQINYVIKALLEFNE
jgi:dTDP-4-amino-4,6-dideoxygalactose transaminase